MTCSHVILTFCIRRGFYFYFFKERRVLYILILPVYDSKWRECDWWCSVYFFIKTRDEPDTVFAGYPASRISG
jgi:hypothetical protein